MKGPPDVTILVAAYNRIELLKESIGSALEQDYDSFDVLVVDDGSDEETRYWLNAEAGLQENLVVIHQENRGIAHARQRGLLEARGEYVCILDSDDRLLPNALRYIMDVIGTAPEIDLVYTNNFHRMPDGKIYKCLYPRFESNDAMIRWTLFRPRVPFKHSGTTFRRDTALAIGGYNTLLPIKVDVEFFLRFLTAGRRLDLMDKPVVEFRMHRDSLSRQRILGIKVWWLLIDRYGPRSWLFRLGYKSARTFAELFKWVYQALLLGSRVDLGSSGPPAQR